MGPVLRTLLMPKELALVSIPRRNRSHYPSAQHISNECGKRFMCCRNTNPRPAFRIKDHIREGRQILQSLSTRLFDFDADGHGGEMVTEML